MGGEESRWTGEEMLPALFTRGAKGCEPSFREFHRLTEQKLRRVLTRVLGHTTDVDDVLQEVYVKAWLSVDQFTSVRGTVMAWLSTIARNLAIDSLRRRGAQPVCVTASFEPDALPYEHFASDVRSGEDIIHYGRAAATLRVCVDSLPAVRRQVVTLAFYADMTHGEVADRMKMPLGTVKSTVRRSLEGMRIQMGEFRAA